MTMDTITHATLAGVDVVTPSPRAVGAFESELGPNLNRVPVAILESLTLGAVRDALVPELMSLELRGNERATQTVLEQAEALSLAWAA
jgi:hypothetical protein